MLHFIKSTVLMATAWIIAMALIILIASPYAAEAATFRLNFIDENDVVQTANLQPIQTEHSCSYVMEDYANHFEENKPSIDTQLFPFEFVDVGEAGQLIFIAEVWEDYGMYYVGAILFECIEDLGA